MSRLLPILLHFNLCIVEKFQWHLNVKILELNPNFASMCQIYVITHNPKFIADF